jgi:outer membrane protein assembly factor BamB
MAMRRVMPLVAMIVLVVSATPSVASPDPFWSKPGPDDPIALRVDHDAIAVGGSIGDVALLDIDGREIWRRSLLEGPLYFAPGIGSDTVVVSTGEHVVALDRQTGDEIWRRTMVEPGRIAIGHAADGAEILVMTTAEGINAAFDLRTGTKRWAYDLQLPALFAGSVSVVDGIAVFGWTQKPNGRVSAVEIGTGKVLWEDGLAIAAAEPIIADGKVLIAEGNDVDARVRAMDLETGEQLWATTVDARWFLPGYLPTASNGSFYVPDGSGAVLAVDIETGRVRWRRRVLAPDATLAFVIAVGKLLVVSGEGAPPVTADRRTGAVVATGDGAGSVKGLAVLDRRQYVELVGFGTQGVVRTRPARPDG